MVNIFLSPKAGNWNQRTERKNLFLAFSHMVDSRSFWRRSNPWFMEETNRNMKLWMSGFDWILLEPRRLTNASPSSCVQGHSIGTLTYEGSHSVDTLAIGAHAWKHYTLIHICAHIEKEKFKISVKIQRDPIPPSYRFFSNGRSLPLITIFDMVNQLHSEAKGAHQLHI